MAASFPGAELNYVQMQREVVTPAADCEMVARLRAPLGPGPPDAGPGSYVAAGPASTLVTTGAQLAFGPEESDLKLAFERLRRRQRRHTGLDHVIMSHLYTTSSASADRTAPFGRSTRAVRTRCCRWKACRHSIAIWPGRDPLAGR